MHRLPAGTGPQFATASRRTQSWWLVGGALLLAAAFVVAPASLAGGDYGSGFLGGSGLPDAVRDNFVQYWRSGDGRLSAGMNNLSDYWLRYHVVKAVIAALLVAVLSVLTVRLWKRFINAETATGSRRLLGIGSAAAGVTAMAGVVLVMANIQGAVAPFSSLLSMLSTTGHDAALEQTTGQVASDLRAGTGSPALDGMVHNFAIYHATLAGTAVALAAVAITFGALMLRSYAGTPRELVHNRRARLTAAGGIWHRRRSAARPRRRQHRQRAQPGQRVAALLLGKLTVRRRFG